MLIKYGNKNNKYIYRLNKILCAPDNYSTKDSQKYFKQFQSLTMIT
jgi:hypothetical protein